MSHTKVKTTYSVEGVCGSTETKTLYCHHNHGGDCVTFYDDDGSVTGMCFFEWEKGNDLWDAMQRLWFPFKDKWGGELKDGVEYYFMAPWEYAILQAFDEAKEKVTCPDCEETIPLTQDINTDRYGNLKYYYCKNCEETFVSQNGGELGIAAHH